MFWHQNGGPLETGLERDTVGDDLGSLVRLLKMLDVAGNNVVGIGSVGAFVEAVVRLMVRDLQRLTRQYFEGYFGQNVQNVQSTPGVKP